MTNKANLRYYDKHYSENLLWKGDKDRQADYFLQRSGIQVAQQKEKALDVGCGDGTLANKLMDELGYISYGIDLSSQGIKIAERKKVQAKVADFNKRWPFKKHMFDLVVALQVLEHVYDPDFFLAEASRVLKPGGQIVISTPNLAAWYNRIIFLLGYQPFFLEVSTLDKTVGLDFTRRFTDTREPMGHIRVFTHRALVDILKLHKFSIVRQKGGTEEYFPMLMRYLDKAASNFTSLATDLIIVAKK